VSATGTPVANRDHGTANGRQLSQGPTRDCIHVLLTNVSHEERKRGMVLGIAEKTHEELVACVK
jgi:hypothetical protein